MAVKGQEFYIIHFVISTRDLWTFVLRTPLSRRSHWRWMMSVAIDRIFFCTFLTAWGDVFVVTVTGGSPVGQSFCTAGYSFWTLFQGWLAAPLTLSIALVCWRFFRGTPILAGGIGVARLVFPGFVVFFVLVLGQLLCQCYLLVTRLGLMPCSAWSKKMKMSPIDFRQWIGPLVMYFDPIVFHGLFAETLETHGHETDESHEKTHVKIME